MSTNTYLNTLIARQLREGWSDREMSRQMRVSNATWTRIRGGQRGMGVEVMARAMRRFPEYDAEALFFLRSDAAVSSISANGKEQSDAVAA